MNLDDLILQTAVRLEGVKTHLAEELREKLLALRGCLKTVLDGEDELSQMNRKVLKQALGEINAVLAEGFTEIDDWLNGEMQTLSEILSANEQAVWNAAGISAKVADKSALRLLAVQPLSVEGIYSEPLLQPFIKAFGDNQQRRISAAIVQGAAQGLTNQQIRQKIIGTKKAGFSDGIIGASVRAGNAVVRTGVQHVASMARQATVEANADIVEGIKLIATLDSRTSTLCRSLDGKVYPLDSGPRPPLHINCRTSFTVVLKAPYRGKETAGERASKDGTVLEGLTYYEWLATQDRAFQDEVLGKSWGQLFREGGLSAKQFADLRLDRQFKQRTLTDFIDAMPPVKIVTKVLPEAMFELSQLRNKFKHAAVFGLNTRQTNFENWLAYRDALVGHLNHSATKQFGIYRNPKKSKVFYNGKDNIAIVFSEENVFVTAFSPEGEQLKNYLESGFLL